MLGYFVVNTSFKDSWKHPQHHPEAAVSLEPTHPCEDSTENVSNNASISMELSSKGVTESSIYFSSLHLAPVMEEGKWTVPSCVTLGSHNASLSIHFLKCETGSGSEEGLSDLTFSKAET